MNVKLQQSSNERILIILKLSCGSVGRHWQKSQSSTIFSDKVFFYTFYALFTLLWFSYFSFIKWGLILVIIIFFFLLSISISFFNHRNCTIKKIIKLWVFFLWTFIYGFSFLLVFGENLFAIVAYFPFVSCRRKAWIHLVFIIFLHQVISTYWKMINWLFIQIVRMNTYICV